MEFKIADLNVMLSKNIQTFGWLMNESISQKFREYFYEAHIDTIKYFKRKVSDTEAKKDEAKRNSKNGERKRKRK